MTALKDHQFEILPDTDAQDGLVFGIGARISVDGEGGFDPGETEWTTQDQQNTRRGVRGFGRDVRGPKTWLWQSHINEEDVETAVATLEDFASAWSPLDLALEPGKQTALRYRLAGRDRRVFGRPRRFAAPPSNRILNGYVPVTHDFALVDSHTYDDIESMVRIPYATGATGGGWSFPTTFPIVTQPSDGTGDEQLSVGGTARAYPVIRFLGPWTNPVIVADNWNLRWKGAIPANTWVEIDTRPWALTVLNQDGASRVGGLDRRTWLEDIWFAPKSKPQIHLSGSAASGDAACEIRWRNTWNSI